MSGTAIRQGRRPSRPASRRSASVSGASAGSAVAPQQNPGTDAARLSSGSPTNGVNTVSPQPSASCCRRLRLPAKPIFTIFRRNPGQQAEAQPDDRVGVSAERGEVAHGVAHQKTIVRRERQEGRRDVCHGGIEAGKAAALDQYREAAGQSSIGQALHQFGERTCPARSERHVEGAVEPLADADSAASPFGIADQQLRPQRRRKRAILGRCGQARGRVVVDRHRTPIRCGRVRAVQRPAQGGACGVAAKHLGHDPSLGEQRRKGVKEGLVPGREAIGGQIRAL